MLTDKERLAIAENENQNQNRSINDLYEIAKEHTGCLRRIERTQWATIAIIAAILGAEKAVNLLSGGLIP